MGIDENNIAWSSDIQYKFSNIKDAPGGKSFEDIQWHDMQDGTYFITVFYLIFYILQSISLSGWELPVSQISVSFGEEYQEVLKQEITKYTSITNLKYHHSKERNISCYLQQML